MLTSALPNGLRNETYSEAIRTAGGIGPYTFSYSGTLPAGLTLNTSTGAISGTPTTASLTNFGITVSDSTYPTAQVVTQDLSLRITSVLTVTTSAILPNIKKNVAISPLTLVAKGGASPYTWSLVSGALPGGVSLDPQTGQYTGTPIEKGDFVFTVKVTDNAGATDQKELFWHISEVLSIDTGAVPDGAKGVPVSIALSAKGGVKPYAWTLKSGTLPAGLAINAGSGTIYGTPTTKQTYSFTIEVSDSDSPAQKAEKTYIMEVLDSLYVFTKTVPNGRINDPYTATIEAKLGTPPYAWRLDSGTLPAGLQLNTSSTVATVEGTPETTGPYTYVLEVSDSGTPVQRNTKEFTFQVYSDVRIDSTGIKTATKGVPYSDSVVVTGGLLPYVYSITAGSLPAGLALNTTTGDITGTTDVTVGQSLAFTIRVTDSGNPSDYAERQFAIYVIAPLEITTASIQNAIQKSFYQATLSGNGGISPYTWGISDGTLPQGIAIDTATGILSGTPVVCGAFNFTALLTDSAPTPNTFPKSFNLNLLCSNDYDLAGTIPTLAGATVTLSDNQTSIATTDSNGSYKFQHLTNGNYTVTPFKHQYWFEPTSKTVTVNNLDMTGVDFIAHADSTPPVVGITINGGGDSQAKNGLFTQTATATDPSPSMTYSWSKQAGPGTVTFGTVDALSSTITASLEGTYTIRFTATDAAGNSAFSDMTLVWDTTPPVAVIGAPSATVTKAGPVTYTVTYTDADAVTLAAGNVTLVKTGTADGTIAVSGTENITRTVTISGITGDGTLGISIAAGTASDLAGNQAIAVGPSATFIVDNTPPVVNPGGNQTKNGTFTQTATGTDANTMTYAWSKQAGPGTVIFGTVDALSSTITASLEGTYTIRFTATDAAGNSAFSDMTLVWDTTPPVAVIGAPSTTVTKAGPVTYTVTYTDADAVTLAAGNVTLVKTGTVDGTIAVSGTENTTRTVTISGITGDGTLGISIAAATASDVAGNQALAAGPSAAFTVDNTPPAPFTLTGLPDGSFTESRLPALSWNATSDATTSVQKYQLFINDSLNADSIAPTQTTISPTGSLPDGVYRWFIRAIDATGNYRDSDTKTITIDGTAPTSVITSPLSNAKLGGTTAAVSGAAADGAGSGVQKVEISTDGGGTWHGATGTTSWSYTWTLPAADGRFSIKSRATDFVGHVEVPGVGIEVAVDNAAPVGTVTIDAGAEYTRERSVNLTITASDTNGISQMAVSNNGSMGEWEAFAVSKSWALSEGDGVKTVSVWFKDGLGNVSATPVTDTIILDATPPELTLNPVTTPTGLNQQTIAGTVADATAVTVTMDTAASDGEATISGNTWNFVVSGLVEGTNEVTVTARDAAGNVATAATSIRYVNAKGDVNGDWTVNLQDAIAALQVFSGMNSAVLRADFAASGADVNGDGRVGIAEVLYIFQKIAGMRNTSGDPVIQ